MTFARFIDQSFKFKTKTTLKSEIKTKSHYQQPITKFVI